MVNKNDFKSPNRELEVEGRGEEEEKKQAEYNLEERE